MTNDEFKIILEKLGIGNLDFFEFMNGKVKRYPLKDFGWGCFPILNAKDEIVDIRILVPDFLDENCIKINVHEYTHAFELYNELGKVYVEDRDAREIRAKKKEEEYQRMRTKNQNKYF